MPGFCTAIVCGRLHHDFGFLTVGAAFGINILPIITLTTHSYPFSMGQADARGKVISEPEVWKPAIVMFSQEEFWEYTLWLSN